MTRNRSKTRSNSVAKFETLEGRKLMSGTPYVVDGTAGDDVIEVSYGELPVLTQDTGGVTIFSGTMPTGPTVTDGLQPADASAMRITNVRANASGIGASTTLVPNQIVAFNTTGGQTVDTGGSSASTIEFKVNPHILDSTIFNRLVITVNGVSHTPTLEPGQNIVVNGLSGNDHIRVKGMKSGVVVNGGSGDDTLLGDSGNETLNGDAGNDWVDGGGGADVMSGGAGIDTIDYANRGSRVVVNLDGAANDGYDGEGDNVAADFEIINGGWGNDYLVGAADTVGRTFNGGYGNDLIIGGAGDDTINAGAGDDTSLGGAGNDTIFADSGTDGVYGDAGNDRLYGGTGADFIRGGVGDDVIVTLGGTQSDRAFGDAGNDIFWVDGESTEMVHDASAYEKRNSVNRVAAFEALRVSGTVVGHPSREMNIGNLPDPNTTVDGNTFAYQNFRNVPLFNNDMPIMDDINQGSVGDCYFLATLSATAKKSPQMIRQSVVDLGDGTYAVKLRRDGVSRFVRVDADLPVNSFGRLAFTHWQTSGQSMWAPIMEKAWAFFRNSTGTYAGTAAGFPAEVFRTLGMPNGTYDPYKWFNDDPQKFGKKLASLLSQGKAVTLCTGDGVFLEGPHCYVVDRVEKIGSTVVSIYLRNPWGDDGKTPISTKDNVDDGYIKLDATEALASTTLIQYGQPL